MNLDTTVADPTFYAPMPPSQRRPAGDDAGRLLSETIPELSSGAWRLRSCRITEVRKQRRKRIVFYRLSYLDGAGRPARSAEIVAKVYGSDRGAKAHGVLRQLWDAGFRPPAWYRVPRPYGYSPERGTLLQESVRGTAWADRLQDGGISLRRASARAAAWLLLLQRRPVTGEVYPWRDGLAAAQRFTAELSLAYPRFASRLQALTQRLTPRLNAQDVPLVPSHGDYHAKNVFLSNGLTTVMDFDTFGLREAAFDVGYAIGQMLIMSRLRLGRLAPGAEAAAAFWRRYRRGGQAVWTRVAAHVARTFLQSLHFELCTLHNNRVELLDMWPHLMEEWLDSHGPGTLEDIIRRS